MALTIPQVANCVFNSCPNLTNVKIKSQQFNHNYLFEAKNASISSNNNNVSNSTKDNLKVVTIGDPLFAFTGRLIPIITTFTPKTETIMCFYNMKTLSFAYKINAKLQEEIQWPYTFFILTSLDSLNLLYTILNFLLEITTTSL